MYREKKTENTFDMREIYRYSWTCYGDEELRGTSIQLFLHSDAMFRSVFIVGSFHSTPLHRIAIRGRGNICIATRHVVTSTVASFRIPGALQLLS